jgi:hypothetical protein
MVFMIDRGVGDRLASAEISISQRIAELGSDGMDQKAALKLVAKERGIGKSEAYRLLQSEKQ